MIVTLQNGNDTRTYNEPHIKQVGAVCAVCMRERYTGKQVECGRYLEATRARGVVYEMNYAYSRGVKYFDMPVV